MNTNTEHSDDKKSNQRLTQDNIERENSAYSRGAMTSTVVILAILSIIGYFYYQTSYIPASAETVPVGTTMMATPAVTNTTATDSNTTATDSSTSTATTPDSSSTTTATTTP